MSTRAELIARLTARLPKPIEMPEPSHDFDEEICPPTLLPGDYMVHNNRRQEYPPNPIGYERALEKAEETLRRDLYEDDFIVSESHTSAPASKRRRSSNLRAEAPVFTPTKVTNSHHSRIQPVIPRMNPADRFRDNNKHVVKEAFGRTSSTENKKEVRWEGSDDSGSLTPKGPPTWLEKMETLVRTKLKPSPYERGPVEGDGRRAPRAPQMAVPRYFNSPHLRA